VSVEIALLLADRVARGDVRLAAELRLRIDGLGLSAKGKKDLRLEVVAPPEPPEPFSLDEYRAAGARRHLDQRRRLLTEQRYGDLTATDRGGNE
jgi:hypothetical protein